MQTKHSMSGQRETMRVQWTIPRTIQWTQVCKQSTVCLVKKKQL